MERNGICFFFAENILIATEAEQMKSFNLKPVENQLHLAILTGKYRRNRDVLKRAIEA